MTRERFPYDARRDCRSFTIPREASRSDINTIPAVDTAGAGVCCGVQSVLPRHSGAKLQTLQLAAGWPCSRMHSAQLVSKVPHSISVGLNSQAQHRWAAAGAGVPNQSAAAATRGTIQTRAIILRIPHFAIGGILP